MKWLAIAGATVWLLIGAASDAAATSCGDITPGGQMGPEVPEGPYNPAFTLDFEDACFVQWEGGTRGEAGRQADRRKCESLAGAEMLDFVPDGGSNFNLCVYRILASGDGGEDADLGAGMSDEMFSEEPSASDQDSYDSAATSQASRSQGADHGNYTLQICNKTGKNVSVALGLFENPDHEYQTLQGWWTIRPQSCEQWSRALGRYSSHTVYYHAENDSGSWGDSTTLCIQDAAFTRVLTSGYQCESWERLAEFSQVEVKQGVKVVNLTE